MPLQPTKYFGNVEYHEGSALEFPRGLPGFEGRRRFLALHFPDSDPLIYLQDMDNVDLCFLTMPVLALDREYRLHMAPEDLELIDFETARRPVIGKDVLCLAVLALREEGPAANLLAPLVVNLRSQKGVQAVTSDSPYSHQHALFPQEALACS